MPKEIPNKRYTPGFKKLVIETMPEKKLRYCKVERRFKGQPPTYLPQKVEEDLLAAVQLLRATFYYHPKRINRTNMHKAVKEEITAIYHENASRYG